MDKTKEEEEEDVSSLSESLRNGFREIIKTGEFKATTKIGKGSYGQVYQGEYEGKVVAAKKMKISKDTYLRIKREIMILSKLNHQNIVSFGGVIMRDEKTIFYMTELMEGGNMGSYLKKLLGQMGFSKNLKKVFPVAQRLSYCSQIVSGLSYIHKHGIIHRDIKLENILISKDLKVIKICDFGFARPIGAEFSLKEIEDTNCTWATILANSIAGQLKRETKKGEWVDWEDDGLGKEEEEEEEEEEGEGGAEGEITEGKTRPRRKTIIGTPIYMAPEIFTQIYDGSVDVYAYGVLAINIFTAKYHLKVLAAREMEIESILEAQAAEGVGLDKRTIHKMESENISSEIIDLFSLCLSVTPQHRPDLNKLRNSFVSCLLEMEKKDPTCAEWILDEFRSLPLPEAETDDFFSDTPVAPAFPSTGSSSEAPPNPLQQSLVCFVQKQGAKGFLDMVESPRKGTPRGGTPWSAKSPSRFASPASPVFNWKDTLEEVPDVLLLAERMGAVGFLGMTGGESAPPRPALPTQGQGQGQSSSKPKPKEPKTPPRYAHPTSPSFGWLKEK